MKQMDYRVLGKDCIFPADTKEIGRNLNTLVIGGSGSGKTFSIVQPTLQRTNSGSLVISDPKGRLVKAYAPYFEKKGYRVRILDFIDPANSPVGFDPMHWLKAENEQEIMSVASMMYYGAQDGKVNKADPFWDQMAVQLLAGLMAFLLEECDEEEQTMASVGYLATLLDGSEDACLGYSRVRRQHKDPFAEKIRRPRSRKEDTVVPEVYESWVQGPVGMMFHDVAVRNRDEGITEDPFSLRCWKQVHAGADKTIQSIYITLNSLLGRLSTKEMKAFSKNQERVIRQDLLLEKTVVFVKCSDVDPTLHFYANVFYSLLMKNLFERCDYFMDCSEHLHSVHFILDDFASSVYIKDMPLWISTMRERNISVTLIVQSATQLKAKYGEYDAHNIMANCDNMVYLRSNDYQSAEEFSLRLNIPAHEILNMPVGTEYVFCMGCEPLKTKRYDMREDEEYQAVYCEKIRMPDRIY